MSLVSDAAAYQFLLPLARRGQIQPGTSITDADRQMVSSRRIQPILFSEDQQIQIYSAEYSPDIPKDPVCHEDWCTSHPDPIVRQAYNGCKLAYEFFKREFGRNSLDNQGQPIQAVVHYQDEKGKKLSNAYWDPNSKMVLFGDGNGVTTQSFVSDIDNIGHELTHGIISSICPELSDDYESGALNEHLSDVFGIMLKQYSFPSKQQAKDSDWLIGDNTYRDTETRKITLRSMKDPSNGNLVAYPQPSHINDFYKFGRDVHYYSGIPNHAFYLAATNIGGYTWKKVGKVWYEAMLKLQSNENFSTFANKTVSAAKEYFPNDSSVVTHIVNAWNAVGISTIHTTSQTTQVISSQQRTFSQLPSPSRASSPFPQQDSPQGTTNSGDTFCQNGECRLV